MNKVTQLVFFEDLIKDHYLKYLKRDITPREAARSIQEDPWVQMLIGDGLFEVNGSYSKLIDAMLAAVPKDLSSKDHMFITQLIDLTIDKK